MNIYLKPSHCRDGAGFGCAPAQPRSFFYLFVIVEDMRRDYIYRTIIHSLRCQARLAMGGLVGYVEQYKSKEGLTMLG